MLLIYIMDNSEKSLFACDLKEFLAPNVNRNKSSIKNYRRIAKLAQSFCQLCFFTFFFFFILYKFKSDCQIIIHVRWHYFKYTLTLLSTRFFVLPIPFLDQKRKILKPDSQMLYDVACNLVLTTPATMTVSNNIGLHVSHGFGRRIVLHKQQLFSDKILSWPALWWGHIGITSTRRQNTSWIKSPQEQTLEIERCQTTSQIFFWFLFKN